MVNSLVEPEALKKMKKTSWSCGTLFAEPIAQRSLQVQRSWPRLYIKLVSLVVVKIVLEVRRQ